MPKIIRGIPDISNASGTKSKHTIEIIRPDANDKMKLKNLFDVFLKATPISPPMVVPNVPKNNPISVVFSKYGIPSSYLIRVTQCVTSTILLFVLCMGQCPHRPKFIFMF